MDKGLKSQNSLIKRKDAAHFMGRASFFVSELLYFQEVGLAHCFFKCRRQVIPTHELHLLRKNRA